VAEFKRAAELEPYYAAPHLMLARLYDSSGMAQEALDNYRAYVARAARDDAGYANAQERIATLDAQLKATREAPDPGRRRRALLPLAAAAQEGVVRPRSTAEDLQMFSQVLNQIRVNHPDSIDTHRLFMAAVEGMVRAADPHSYVITAARLSPQKEKDFREGRLFPVPIEWDFARGTPVVRSVAPGSAAARQDILPGDVLVSADGQPVRAESPFELEVVLSGARNSTVALRLERERVDGSVAELERVVRRERAEEGTAVPAVLMLDDSTGYVRVTTFSNIRAAEDLHAALASWRARGCAASSWTCATTAAGWWTRRRRWRASSCPRAPSSTRPPGRKADVSRTVQVQRSFWRRERQYPVVLMVNEGTASASELVAGALQDHDRALVVGRPTFGKSLLMRGFPMTDGSAIMMVIGHIKTPCGRVVQRQYRDLRVNDYYRMARTARDTAGRPSCRTAAGRVVYGGGGIFPDVVTPEAEPDPLWLARLREEGLPTRWIGGYLSANAASFPSADALAASPRLPDAALADFRAFAARAGHTLPPAPTRTHACSACWPAASPSPSGATPVLPPRGRHRPAGARGGRAVRQGGGGAAAGAVTGVSHRDAEG
jgi:carboxyl-terminal processing protease